jgi:hypothetical protein
MGKPSKDSKEVAIPEAVTQELTATQEILDAFAGWFRNLRAFFIEAHALEIAAQDTLAKARLFKLPTTAQEDEALQVFTVNANKAAKHAEEKWAITKSVHALHKRLTAKRAKAVDPNEAAAQITNDLHNEYKRLDALRVEQERARLQKIEDDAAQARRDKELAALEQQALDSEAASDDLSAREQSFVALLAINTPTEAARKAGYKNPAQAGQRLMASAKIQKAIDALKAARALRDQQDALKAAPVVATVVEVAANVTKAAGVTERTTWAGEVTDLNKLIDAVIAGTVPRDVLMVNQVTLNGYARAMRDLMTKNWPGVRAVPTTKAI